MADGQGGDPAQAFEDLRAEVSVLRRAIEAMPAAVRESRSPDYSEDLGVLGKGLDDLGDQLSKIMKAPALVRTPEEQGQAIAQAGAGLVREAAQRIDHAAQRLDRAAQEAERERSRLDGIIGQALTRNRQFKVLCWAGGLALVAGLVISPFIASVLPFGLNARVAALVMHTDRWSAGTELMQAANVSGWNRIAADTHFVSDNQYALDACRATAAKTGKAQHCAITVAPPSRSQDK
ncbi:MAG TPA: DUF6118 family protein [Caulobacteraceae bacterium]|jgi:hypothetical protein